MVQNAVLGLVCPSHEAFAGARENLLSLGIYLDIAYVECIGEKADVPELSLFEFLEKDDGLHRFVLGVLLFAVRFSARQCFIEIHHDVVNDELDDARLFFEQRTRWILGDCFIDSKNDDAVLFLVVETNLPRFAYALVPHEKAVR